MGGYSGLVIQGGEPFSMDVTMYFKYGKREFAAHMKFDESYTSGGISRRFDSFCDSAIRTMHKEGIMRTHQGYCECIRCDADRNFTDYIKTSSLLP